MLKWILIFLMLPVVASGQYVAPSQGTTNADSLRGKFINSVPSIDQYIPKYFSSGDTIGWVADAGGGGDADSLQGRPLPPNTSPSDNQLLKVDTTPDPDTFYWANDNSAAGGDTALYLAAANGTLPYVNMTGDTVWVKGSTGGADDVHIRAGSGDNLVVWPDTLIISGDRINDFAGTGLTVVTNALTADLGTSIESSEIVDQTIVKANIDSTSSDVVFDDAYKVTSAEADSMLITQGAADADYEGKLVNSAGLAAALDDETGTSLAVFSTSPTFTTKIVAPLVVGGEATTSDLSLKTTKGVGETGADMHFLVGNDGGTEAMTILNNGSIGIGETVPDELLHIKTSGGNELQYGLKLQNPNDTAPGTATGILFKAAVTGGGYSKAGIVFERRTTNGRGHIHFLQNNVSDASDVALDDVVVTITRDGCLGIGTIAPTCLLTLEKDGSGSSWIKFNDTQVDGKTFWINNGTSSIGGAGYAGFELGSTNIMTFEESSGNIGIGTNVPPQALSVVGNIAFGDTTAGDVDDSLLFGRDGAWDRSLTYDDGLSRFRFDDNVDITVNSATLKLEDDSGNWGAVNVGNSQICVAVDPDNLVVSSDICFDIDGNEVARFHQSTDFGVGTLSPPEKISAVGNIATGDTAAGDVDIFHYFSTDGSWITEYLKWDDGVGRFEISDDFDIGGNLSLSGTATLGTVAGAIDAGSATSLEIPNSDNPTTDANGEIAADNNSNALEVYIPSESESGLISFYKQLSIPIVLPDSVQAYVPDLKVWQVNALVHPFGIEIDSVSIQLDADAAYSMIFEEWTGADPPVYQNAISTVTTGASDTYAAEAPDTDAAIDAGDWIVLDIPTTDVPVVTVGIIYHVTEGN